MFASSLLSDLSEIGLTGKQQLASYRLFVSKLDGTVLSNADSDWEAAFRKVLAIPKQEAEKAMGEGNWKAVRQLFGEIVGE